MLPTHRWKASFQCGCVVSCFPLVLADCVPTSLCPLHAQTKPSHRRLLCRCCEIAVRQQRTAHTSLGVWQYEAANPPEILRQI